MNKDNLQEEYTLHDTNEAAPKFGCLPATLKQSRVSGELFGKPTPPYLKLGKSVRYKSTTIDAWLDQFEEITVPQN